MCTIASVKNLHLYLEWRATGMSGCVFMCSIVSVKSLHLCLGRWATGTSRTMFCAFCSGQGEAIAAIVLDDCARLQMHLKIGPQSWCTPSSSGS